MRSYHSSTCHAWYVINAKSKSSWDFGSLAAKEMSFLESPSTLMFPSKQSLNIATAHWIHKSDIENTLCIFNLSSDCQPQKSSQPYLTWLSPQPLEAQGLPNQDNNDSAPLGWRSTSLLFKKRTARPSVKTKKRTTRKENALGSADQ